MPRFAELGVIAEMSPSTWHIFGRLLGDPPRDAWEFGTLNEHGAMLTIGTDWVVTPTPNLFPALEGMLGPGGRIDRPAGSATGNDLQRRVCRRPRDSKRFPGTGQIR